MKLEQESVRPEWPRGESSDVQYTSEQLCQIEAVYGLLGSEFALFRLLREHHWNEVGQEFAALRPVLERQHEELDRELDAILETLEAVLARSPGARPQPAGPGWMSRPHALAALLVHRHGALLRQLDRVATLLESQEAEAEVQGLVIRARERHRSMIAELQCWVSEEE